MKTAGLAVAIILALASLALAQGKNKNKRKGTDIDHARFDVGFAYGGVFSKTSTASQSSVTLKPTTSGTVLASFRYHFNHTHGVEVNFSHTSNSQVFSVPPDTFRVNNGITEFSGAYVFSPLHAHRIDPFLLAGGGTLKFNSGNQFIDGTLSPFGASSQRALAVLYGAGVDYRLWKRLALRVQYRGLIYKTPDFHVPVLHLGRAHGGPGYQVLRSGFNQDSRACLRSFRVSASSAMECIRFCRVTIPTSC
jgi:opacity protein-like surface antigen